ncbi:MAG: NAD-dependent epimerase/dehydratase family protein [Streptosporangiaceae bacterium]
MSRVVVIGATGHIGSYLVPRLVRGGHDVTAMSRGIRGPYGPSPQWKSVTKITVDREAQDNEGPSVPNLDVGGAAGRGAAPLAPAAAALRNHLGARPCPAGAGH